MTHATDPHVHAGPPPSSAITPLTLEMSGISKSFTGVRVLENVAVQIRGGEVHTIMGENGAGKSTLMKILAGVHRPDAGSITLNGQPITLASPQAALQAGITLIHQEPLNFPDLTVAENIFLGRRVPRTALGTIDSSTMNRRAAELIKLLGVNLSPKRRMNGLSIADQQMVELAAALSQDARVLLMDEPTAALTPSESEELFRIVRGLRDRGVAIVFVSHRLPEVFQISDRITVLRDGNFVGTRTTGETTPEEIVQMMVGRPLAALYDKAPATIGEPLLEVSGLSRAGQFADINITVRRGEIVGMAGLVGAGRTEAAEAIFGVRARDAGTIKISGKTVRIRSPRDAVKHGIAYVPEDRQLNGLLPPMSIAENTTLASLGKVSRLGFISGAGERAVAEDWRGKLRTRLRDVAQPVRELSGGNQQKVVLSKWLNTRPQVLIVDEPTRGIDVGAKAEVHHVLAELAQQGHAILMISSDLPEVLAMSDRVLVMRGGRITAELARADATQERVMAAAAGTAQSTIINHTPAAAVKQSPVIRLLRNFREIGILLFVILLFAIAAYKQPRFLSAENLRSMALYFPIILIVGIGQLMVIVSRNIDLSVGCILGLAAMVSCGLFVTHPDTPVLLATAIAIGAGALLGAVNGALVVWVRVPAIIATLGTLTAFRGLIYIYSDRRQIDPDKLSSLIPLKGDGPLGIPWLTYIALAVAAIAAVWLRKSVTGRTIYAIGSNPRAAELRGLPVKRVLMLVFAITGALCGLAGVLWGARFGTINPSSVGAELELVVISAVVIGGAAVNGGSGSVIGTLLGCVLLAIISVALPMLDISAFWQSAIYGGAIVLAASLDSVLRRSARAGGAA
ncbi:MAG: ATP-binding cassette domain-containing protein [Burkholderiales bacterium]|nr:ATP-binding cassette domain-containing protein [Phycisphaerae bacterium]